MRTREKMLRNLVRHYSRPPHYETGDETNMNEYRGYFIYVAFSSHDGGYHAEVSDRGGKTIHTTEVFDSHYKAEHAARTFVDKRRAS